MCTRARQWPHFLVRYLNDCFTTVLLLDSEMWKEDLCYRKKINCLQAARCLLSKVCRLRRDCGNALRFLLMFLMPGQIKVLELFCSKTFLLPRRKIELEKKCAIGDLAADMWQVIILNNKQQKTLWYKQLYLYLLTLDYQVCNCGSTRGPTNIAKQFSFLLRIVLHW